MAIVGFSFSKFDCFRSNSSYSGKIEISHNVKIDNVLTNKLNVGGGPTNVLKVDFTFSVLYGDNLGKITLSGDVVFSDSEEIINETLKSWATDKKLPIMINQEISRFIYTKGIIKALEMSDNLNLPAPIPVVPAGMFDQKK